MLVKHFDFRSPREFLGVFICDDKGGNNLLRDMEPPSHNDWEPGRIPGGKKIIDDIKNWIRSCIKEINMANETDSVSIAGLERYFQLPEDDDYEGRFESINDGIYVNQDTKNETASEIGWVKEDTIEFVGDRHKEPVVKSAVSGTHGKNVHLRKGAKDEDNSGGGSTPGDDKVKAFKDISCNVRCILRNLAAGIAEYIVILKPAEEYSGNIKILSQGEDNSYPVEIIGCTDDSNKKVNTTNSYLKDISLEKDSPRKLKLYIQAKHKYSLILE